jgi:hypothetical protein
MYPQVSLRVIGVLCLYVFPGVLADLSPSDPAVDKELDTNVKFQGQINLKANIYQRWLDPGEVFRVVQTGNYMIIYEYMHILYGNDKII